MGAQKVICNQCVSIFNSNVSILVEQCFAIKFCECLKKNIVEAILLLEEVFGNEVLEVWTLTKTWHKIFLNDRELAEFKPQVGKPKTKCIVTKINTVATAFKDDHHPSVEALATELKISWESIRRILLGELGIFLLLFLVGVDNHVLTHLAVSQQIS